MKYYKQKYLSPNDFAPRYRYYRTPDNGETWYVYHKPLKGPVWIQIRVNNVWGKLIEVSEADIFSIML